MYKLSFDGITKKFGGAVAVNNVSLNIRRGEFVSLLGASGCGKTTLLRIIAGFARADSGTISIDGQRIDHLPPGKRGIGFVFQSYALFPTQTVAENIGFALDLRRDSRADIAKRVTELCEIVQLQGKEDRYPHELSGGQQQRVALGRALVAQAKVCLMDEPLSNLDAQLRQDMRRELRELQQKLGLTVVYVTHDQTEAMSMADQVVLLNQGRVEQGGTPRELYARPATTFAARFIGTPPMNLVALESNGRIAGSDVASGVQAAQLGVRPEAITLAADGIPAVVRSVEYLGADLVLRCAVGSEVLLVRAAGGHVATPGERVHLRWPADEAHGFGADGRRIH